MNKKFFLLQWIFTLYLAATPSYHSEGPWPLLKEPSLEFLIKQVASCFLPYNPTVLEIGDKPSTAFPILEKKYPKSQLFLADPYSTDLHMESIDFIRIDVEKNLYATLRSVGRNLQNIKVISLKIPPFTKFSPIRLYLMAMGFPLLSRYHLENEEGESLFISQEIYDAVFR